MTNKAGRVISLDGLLLSHSDPDDGCGATEYDIGAIALHALHAVQKAVLMAEQIVTGEKLVKGLDLADFYASLNLAIEEDNGQGILSEPGCNASLQDEIEQLIEWVTMARSLSRSRKPD